MGENLRVFFAKMDKPNLVELLVAKYGEVEKLKAEIVDLKNKLLYYKEKQYEPK